MQKTPGIGRNWRKGKASRYTHGLYRSRTYKSWSTMKQRCYNTKSPDYARYGARGIVVCRRWHIFENFLKDMGERPSNKTLDRINNNKSYSPSNCKWSTSLEQIQNRRCSKKYKQTNAIAGFTS